MGFSNGGGKPINNLNNAFGKIGSLFKGGASKFILPEQYKTFEDLAKVYYGDNYNPGNLGVSVDPLKVKNDALDASMRSNTKVEQSSAKYAKEIFKTPAVKEMVRYFSKQFPLHKDWALRNIPIFGNEAAWAVKLPGIDEVDLMLTNRGFRRPVADDWSTGMKKPSRLDLSKEEIEAALLELRQDILADRPFIEVEKWDEVLERHFPGYDRDPD
jgi:hypothetical protein